MTSMKKNLLSAAACALMGLASSAQAGAIIDLFVDPAQGQAVSTDVAGLAATAFNQAGSAATTTILGGYRDLSVTKLTGPQFARSSLYVTGGELNFGNDPDVTGKAVVTWDGSNIAGIQGAGVDTTGFGGTGIDVTAGGAADQFLVDVFKADFGFNYSITVWDMDGDRSTLSAGVQFEVVRAMGLTANYFFDWFNLPTGTYCNGLPYVAGTCLDYENELKFGIVRTGTGDIDFTRLGALQLTLEGSRADLDMIIGSIRTVPEPATLGLVGLALLGVGAMSRRSSRKS